MTQELAILLCQIYSKVTQTLSEYEYEQKDLPDTQCK